MIGVVRAKMEALNLISVNLYNFMYLHTFAESTEYTHRTNRERKKTAKCTALFQRIYHMHKTIQPGTRTHTHMNMHDTT